MGVLAAKELSKWYGEVIAVNDLNVEVPEGITGLLGPNGAGKSTFMRMTMGLLKPSRGSIEVLGENPWDNPNLLERIGYLPEGDAPWRDQSGLRSATMAARLSGLSGDAAEEAAASALRRVGLTEAQDRPVAAYSRGMRQRHKLALTLLHDPELLILDEPLLGADPLSRKELIHLIRDLAAQGKSVLVSTHVLPDVEAMTQRILLLNHGRLMAHGEVAHIRDLLERYPRTVRIATPRPRDLGAALWGWESVLSIQAEEGALLVRTRQPQEFYTELQRLLARKDLPFTSVTSPDDNLEAVFRYLVG
jgi:ABC-2 type transport system ATP-binding protein